MIQNLHTHVHLSTISKAIPNLTFTHFSLIHLLSLNTNLLSLNLIYYFQYFSKNTGINITTQF